MTTRTPRSPRFTTIATLDQLARAYPELSRRVLRYLLAVCETDPAAAEDATHDAIEGIARRVRRGEPVQHPLTFACTWARNALRNEQRAAARLQERLTTARPYGRIRVERRATVDDEQRQALREQLTPREFEAFEWRLRGLTVAQAAASLGVPHSTYTSRLQRAPAPPRPRPRPLSARGRAPRHNPRAAEQRPPARVHTQPIGGIGCTPSSSG